MRTIGFAGMTHLGIISAIAAAEKGFKIVCFDRNEALIGDLLSGRFPISEPQLYKLVEKNKNYIIYTHKIEELKKCDVIYIAPDISTDEKGVSDLSGISSLLEIIYSNNVESVVVVLSQVPPGFTRAWKKPKRILYYQVETLIFGQALDRALNPERFIVGCDDPLEPLPKVFEEYLASYKCPVLAMRYESAELAKISINMFLASSVVTTNTLAELCEKIGADWSEIVPSLRLDKRIGPYAYLNPGLGISGGNLERDLSTVISYSTKLGTDCSVINSWITNSIRRKQWLWDMFKEHSLDKDFSKRIGILGLAYKENTNSIKNSPATVLLSKLSKHLVKVFDPIASLNLPQPGVMVTSSIVEALKGVDVLVLATAWDEFKLLDAQILLTHMRGRIVIDPYSLLDHESLSSNGFTCITLGKSHY